MVRVSGTYINMNLPGIESLTSIDLPNIPLLPNREGIYFFLTYNGSIAYIGETDNLQLRIRGHEKIAECARAGDSLYAVVYLLVDDYLERVIMEKSYIKAYKPKYNKETKHYGRLDW